MSFRSYIKVGRSVPNNSRYVRQVDAGSGDGDGSSGGGGSDGLDGLDGKDGEGVPVGGETGQILAKIDENDFNTEWIDNSSVSILEESRPGKHEGEQIFYEGNLYVWVNSEWEVIGPTDIDGYATEQWTTEALESYLTVDAFDNGQQIQTDSISDNSKAIEQNALNIAELEVTKGSVARYKVVDTALGVASRPGELYTNNSDASLVTTVSFAAVDSSSNATKPMNDGDIIEFDFGNGVVRYVTGGSDANALPVTYTDGQHTFSINEEMDVYIYPQNKAGASKDYVDEQDDLKYDKTGGFITGPIKVQVDSPSSQTCYAIYEPEGVRTYYIWNPGGRGENIKHVCLDGSDFEITTTATVSGSKKTVSPAIFGYQNITLSGGTIRPQSASADVTVSHKIDTAHTFEGRAIFKLPSAGDGFTIRGNATDEDKLLSTYHNNGGATKDAINYAGRTDSDSNIQNKASVQDLIQAAGVATPVGAIMMWMNPTAPTGWFLMTGTSFSVNTYPLLHAYLSNTYGYSSGILPNWRNYYPVGSGTDTSTEDSNLGKNYNYKTARPQSKFKTAVSIPNGDARTFNGAGSTNAYSDGLAIVDITGGDSITRPKSIAIHFIIKHD